MSLEIRSILESLAIASTIVVIDLFIAMIVMFLDPTVSVLPTASAYLILEFGLMLVIGACFMARQPLDEEKRVDSHGEPVRAWVWALRGRKILVASVFVLMFAFAIGGLGTIF